MISKKYYIFLFMICALAFFVSLYLLPTSSETAFMYLYDKQYEKSYERYRSLYERGDRSVDVVIPLVNLLLDYAQIETALELMENYVEQRPESVEAWKYLAKIYKEANRSYDYLRALEHIYELQPSVEILREKEKYYGYVGNLQGEVEALQTLVSEYKPTEGEYLELAYQYASRGNNVKALETIRLFLKQAQLSTMDISTISFAIDLFSYQDEGEQAYLLAEKYYKINPSKTTALGLLFALQQGGFYDQGLKFLNHLPDRLRQSTAFRSARVELYLSRGTPLIAYELLKQYLQAEDVPDNLFSVLIELAIQYNDVEVLRNVLTLTDLDSLPDTLLMKAMLTAYLFDRSDIVNNIKELLGDSNLAEHPALELELALFDPELSKEEKQFLFSHYDLDGISKNQRVFLAEAARSVGNIPVASEFIKELNSLEQLDQEYLDLLTELLIETGLTETGLKLANAAMDGDEDDKKYERFWLLMAAANNQKEEIERWLKDQESLSVEMIRDAFYAAYSQKYASLSLMLAEKLFVLSHSEENKKILAQAYLLDGQPETAFNILRELLSRNIDVAELYLNSLIVLSAENDEYRQFLDNAVKGFLKHRVLSQTAWRNLGYLMLEYQQKALAASVFAHLAKDKSIGAPDMETLLWIWDKELTEDQIEWILSRASTSEGSEKAKWLQYFLNIENPELAFQIISEEDLDNEAIVDRYLDALIMAKEKAKLKKVIAYLIPQESSLPRLKKLGQLAYGEGLRTIAEGAFKRVLEQDSNDPDAIRLLGYIYYFQGDYSQALPMLQKVENQPTASFYIAEIFQIKGWVGYAKDYYLCSYRQYHNLQQPEDDETAVYGTVLFRLGRHFEALSIYKKLLQKQPQDQYLIAAYANLLLDLGDVKGAGQALWAPMSETPNESILLARVRYYSENLCFIQALRLSEELCTRYPDSGQVRAVRASVEWTLDRWRKAYCSIRNARALEPENEIYCLTQREMLRTHRPETMASFEYRVTGNDQYERYGYFSYRHPLDAANLLFLKLDIDNIDVENYVNISTGALENRHAKRYKGEVSWIYRMWCGGVLTSSLYYNGENLGAGAIYVHPDLHGSTTLVLEYHRPNWDFTQTIIEEGNRDRLAFKRVQPVLPRFEISFGAGLNKYHLKGLSNAASSWTLDGGATYLLSRGNPVRCLMGNEGVVSFNYYLDAEYEIKEKERINSFGQPFSPFPLVSRETHAAFLFLAKRFGKCLAADGFGGLSYDREAGGNPVPIWGSQVHFGDLDKFHGRIEYSHSTSTEFSNQNVDRYLIDLRWLW